MAIAGGRPNTRQIAPHLIVRGGAQAISFYTAAFGAAELYRSEMPGGGGLHAQLQIGDSVVLVSDENLQQHAEAHLGAPPTLGGTCAFLELYVDDVDVSYVLRRSQRSGVAGHRLVPGSYECSRASEHSRGRGAHSWHGVGRGCCPGRRCRTHPVAVLASRAITAHRHVTRAQARGSAWIAAPADAFTACLLPQRSLSRGRVRLALGARRNTRTPKPQLFSPLKAQGVSRVGCAG